MTSATTAVTALRKTTRLPSVRGWALAVIVYFLAVFHRSSLGVAGLLAEQRFGIGAGQLSVFVMLQIGVYAAMQIPTGVLVDRYGPRRLLVVASALMGLGQVLFAVAPSYPSALLARALLGCGDAMTFVSVLRFVAARFSARRYPALVALTSLVGMIGNLLATVPLSAALTGFGWTPSFVVAGSLSLAAAVAIWFLLDDRSTAPNRLRTASQVRAGLRSVSARVVLSWSHPATRMGFWVHFASMSTATAFGVLWGQPYLVRGAGFSTSAASTVLMCGVLASAAAGPAVGWFIGRQPTMRVGLAVSVCAVTVVGWLLTVFVFGAAPPQPYVAVLYVLTMFGGPASMVAFSVARDYNDPRILGTASGVVNVGGFAATVVVALGFGWTLNVLGGTSAQHLRWALLVPVVVQSFGALRVFVWQRRVRAHVFARQRRGAEVPVRLHRRYWWDLHTDLDAEGDQRSEKSLAS